MSKSYNIEFTEEEIDTMNEIFKISIKKFNKQLAKGGKIRESKKTNVFFSAINKFYNAKK